ncbi:MAG: translation elongation factor Ts [Coriobacteriia bacterium]
MEITASMVKELRETTGAGMMDCKRALTEADCDMSKAVDILRTKGLADLAKKSGRATNEGLVATHVMPDGRTAAVVEVNCETDFVALNEEFSGFVGRVAAQVAATAPADVASLMGASWSANPSLTVEQALGEVVSRLDENMGITRFLRFSSDAVSTIGSYVHGVGRIGVLVEIAGGEGEPVSALARDIAMHVAAAAPGWIRRDQVPADVIEHEKSIYRAQAAESGKPEAIQEKIATGRLDKFFKEVCLLEQPFVKDPDITVEQLVKRAAGSSEFVITRFARYALGETSDGKAASGC